MLSQLNKAVKFADKVGYRITKEGEMFSPRGKKLKLCGDKRGYLRTSIQMIKGKNISLYIHKLVAYKKYGRSMFRKGMQVRHKNGDKNNNSFENIRLGTAHNNSMDRPKEERIRSAINAASYTRRYSNETIIRIREDRKKNKLTYRALKKKYGVPMGTLNYIFTKSSY